MSIVCTCNSRTVMNGGLVHNTDCAALDERLTVSHCGRTDDICGWSAGGCGWHVRKLMINRIQAEERAIRAEVLAARYRTAINRHHARCGLAGDTPHPHGCETDRVLWAVLDGDDR